MSKFNSNLMRFDCDLIKDFLTADPQWRKEKKEILEVTLKKLVQHGGNKPTIGNV